MSGSYVLGENWLDNFMLFRRKPETYLEKRKLTREAVCFDILKDLYSDNLDPQCKVHLLLLLQENSDILIQDATLIEQIVGSLLNLYDLLRNREDKRLLKSQILISITTILLGWNDEDDCVQKLLLSHKDFLLQLAHCSEDCLLSSIACKCLEEIEILCPNILKPDLNAILSTCEKHMSPALQSYVTLLSLVTKQATEYEKVSKRTEIPDVNDQTLEESKLPVAPSTSDEAIDYLYLVSYLLEQLPYMSHASVYRVLKNLIPVVKHVPQLSANTFRLFLPNLMLSSDVSLFHLAFELLITFKSDLFSDQEEQKLLQQLVSSAANPCLSSAHRLLFLEWLKSFAEQGEFLSKVPVSNLQLLLPSPYDGPITQEKKLYLLCKIIPFDKEENLAVDFLIESLSGLKKCALLQNGNKAAVSFFRILYVYFKSQRNDMAYSTVFKLLMEISKTSPHLSAYALNFLSCVKNELKDIIVEITYPFSTLSSKFYSKAMSNLVDYILSLPMKQVSSNLSNYLAVLAAAAEEAPHVCKPKTLLHRLQIILNDPTSARKDEWSFGNLILSICRNFLKFHDVQLFYFDLAEVLCLVTKNIADVDVKNRSELYYSTLTSLSKTKTQTMFNLQSNESDVNKPLTSFVSESGANLNFAGSIQKLQKPILKLQKISKNMKCQKLELTNYDTSAIDSDVFKEYQRCLSEHNPSVTIPFILKHTEDVADIFSTLYCVVITTYSTSLLDSSTIEVPIFHKKKESDKDVVVSLQLTPKLPHPMKLQFKAEFTCNNCCTYTCDLSPITLEFEDLFLPLPVPLPISTNQTDTWRQQLFNAMWDEFLKMSSELSETKYYESAYRPGISAEKLNDIINNKFECFVVDKSRDSSMAIYIPPLNHLLMKVKTVNGMPFINILVDDVSILPWVTLVLQKINLEDIKLEKKL